MVVFKSNQLFERELVNKLMYFNFLTRFSMGNGIKALLIRKQDLLQNRVKIEFSEGTRSFMSPVSSIAV